MRGACLTLALVVLLTAGCSRMPEWAGGDAPREPEKKDYDKRLPVVAEDALLTPDSKAADITADVPDQVSNDHWYNINDAMQYGHLGITGLEESSGAAIGEGETYAQGIVPTPVVANGMLYAMDGIGAISAHSTKDVSDVKWVTRGLVEDGEPAIMGGGLSLGEHVLYASSGYGKLAAFDAATGKKKWLVSIGVPVRGAPQVAGNIVVVLTVDNQTIGYDASSGRAIWTHRGLRETAGYLSAVSPVVANDMVIAAYSSGEIMALRLTTGDPIWGDALLSPERTRASDVFTGIDADPVVKDAIVYAVSTSGVMVANALLNGRTLWQQKISGHDTPWVVGNMVFLLTNKHQLVGMSRRDGAVVWTKDLAVKGPNGLDETPTLYGPILAGNAVIVFNDDGALTTFRPRDGKQLGVYDIEDDVAAPPVIAEGTLFLVTQNARILAYR